MFIGSAKSQVRETKKSEKMSRKMKRQDLTSSLSWHEIPVMPERNCCQLKPMREAAQWSACTQGTSLEVYTSRRPRERMHAKDWLQCEQARTSTCRAAQKRSHQR